MIEYDDFEGKRGDGDKGGDKPPIAHYILIFNPSRFVRRVLVILWGAKNGERITIYLTHEKFVASLAEHTGQVGEGGIAFLWVDIPEEIRHNWRPTLNILVDVQSDSKEGAPSSVQTYIHKRYITYFGY